MIVLPNTKQCTICLEHKPIEDFHKAKRNKYGRRNYCKACDRLVRDRKIVLPPRGTQTPYTREQKKDWELRRAYGISLEDFLSMVKEQQGLCLICQMQKKLYVDHNHVTGKVRGLLCNTCNRGLGFFHEDEDLLNRAIAYIRR
jgi:hypothetical protein